VARVQIWRHNTIVDVDAGIAAKQNLVTGIGDAVINRQVVVTRAADGCAADVEPEVTGAGEVDRIGIGTTLDFREVFGLGGIAAATSRGHMVRGVNANGAVTYVVITRRPEASVVASADSAKVGLIAAAG
jgi:hypothetical protein